MPLFSLGFYQARVIPEGTNLSQPGSVDFFYFPLLETYWVLGGLFLGFLFWLSGRISKGPWYLRFLILVPGLVGAEFLFFDHVEGLFKLAALPLLTFTLVFLIWTILPWRNLIIDFIILIFFVILVPVLFIPSIGNVLYYQGWGVDEKLAVILINLFFMVPLIVTRVILNTQYSWLRLVFSLMVGVLMIAFVGMLPLYKNTASSFFWEQNFYYYGIGLLLALYIPFAVMMLSSPWLRQVFIGGNRSILLKQRKVKYDNLRGCN